MVDDTIMISTSGKEREGMSTLSMQIKDMTKEKNYEEHIIVTPKDISLPRFVIDGGNYEHGFFCPKCSSSLVYMPEEYSKNNLMNSMKPADDPNIPSGERINEGWEKIVLKCDNCKWTDIVMKFMKERERVDYGGILGGGSSSIRPNRLYTTPSGLGLSSRYNKTWASSAKKARKMWRNTI